MIVCNKKKIAIFLVPKTGTVSLCSIFRPLNLYYNQHSHHTYDKAVLNFSSKLDGFNRYKFFAFYREPIDRFASAIAYFRRTLYKELLSMFYGNQIQISCASVKPYDTLPPDLKAKIEAITISQMLDSNYFKFAENSLIKPQHLWLNNPKISMEYLNFHRYNEEVSNLLSMFGVKNPTNSFPQLNRSIYGYANDKLSEQEMGKVVKMYEEDYNFFDDVGIKFKGT